MSNSVGYNVDTIQLIREILRDLYGCNSIWKELIQNADDAGATHLHLAWISGNYECTTLLHTDILLVLNNGDFDESHVKGIQNIFLGSKGGGGQQIGRFGVGMKSVFHLCEAFFYLASLNQPACSSAGGQTASKLINPWQKADASGSLHPEWSEPEDEIKYLQDQVDKWLHGCSKWFCLAIPLRNQSQLGGKKPIIGKYWTGNDLFPDTLGEEIAPLLTLLANLGEVHIWEPSSNGLVEKCAIDANKGKSFPWKLENRQPGQNHPIAREITVTHTKDGRAQVFNGVGIETILTDPELIILKQNTDWPEVSRTGKDGSEVREKDQGEPHCAVAFSAIKTEGAHELTFSDAVFLPLANEDSTKSTVDGYKVRMMMHGYFFLDSGRKEVYSEPLDKGETGRKSEAEWNRLLKIKGVYPLILEALDKFCSELQMGPEQVSQLAECLHEVIYKYDPQKDFVCEKWQWIRLLKMDGTRQWKLIPKGQGFYALPASPIDKGFTSPLEVLPGLQHVQASALITLDGIPNITLNKGLSWDSEEGIEILADILCSITDTIFREKDHLDYLIKCLKRAIKGPVPAFLKHLSGLISGYRLKNIMNGPKQEFEHLLKTLEKMDDRYLVLLPIADDRCYPVFEHLLNLGLDQLILPANIIKDELGSSNPVSAATTVATSSRSLSTANAAKLFDAISRRDLDGQVKHAFALAIFDATDPKATDKSDKLGGYPLFIVINHKTKRTETVSLAKIQCYKNRNMLYADTDKWLKKLANAVKMDLYSVQRPKGEYLPHYTFLPDLTSSIDRENFCNTLNGRPGLEQPSQRLEMMDFIDSTNHEDWSDDQIKCFRYFVHASQTDFNSDKFLIKEHGSNQNILSKVVGLALNRSGEIWRLVNAELVICLKEKKQDKLNIKCFDKDKDKYKGTDTVIQLLRDIGVTSISWDILLDQERMDLLKKLDPGTGDNSFWKSLPLHRALLHNGHTSDRLMAIDGSAYIENTLPGFPQDVNRTLSELVTVLVNSSDFRLTAIYKDIGISTLTAEQAINEFLSQVSPGKFCRHILDCLVGTSITEDTMNKLRDTKWLPLANSGEFACPGDFINIAGAEQVLSSLLQRPEIKGQFYCFNQIDKSVQGHNYFKQRGKIFPPLDDSLNNLGLCLEEVSDYAIGKIINLNSSSSDDIELIVKTVLNAKLLPGIELLASLNSVNILWDRLNTSLVPHLNRELDKQKYIDVLNGLAQRHENVKLQGEKDDFKCVYDWYLESYLKSMHFQMDDLKKVKLFNKKDQWKASTNLCFHDPSTDIDGEFILDKDQENILFQSGHFTAGQYKTNTAPAQSSTDKKQYFSELTKSCPREYIGCLLALMGDGDPEWKDLAFTYLDKHKVEEIRRLVTFDVKLSPFGNWADVMRQLKPQFMVEGKDRQIQNNIFGDPIRVQISASPTYLICRFLDPQYIGHTLIFRDLQSIKISDKQGIDLIKATANYMMYYIHKQPNTCLNYVWKIIEQGGSFEVFKVKTMASIYLPAKIHELGLNNFRKLKELIDPILNMEVEIAYISNLLYDNPNDIDLQNKLKENLDRRIQLIRNLDSPLKDDPEIQNEIIQAIRKKIENYQYNVKSIPFELFQNADDALNQLANMAALAHAKVPLHPELLVKLDGKSITFANWGRGINQCKLPPDFTQEQGEKLKYHNDMINILGLNYSDKSSDGPKRPLNTGKYGLGFKSIYLITNEPRVLSGGLGFKIIGSTYPVELLAEERNQMIMGIDFPKDATVFSFELRDEIDIAMITDRFNRLMAYALTFSQKIKQYVFVDTITRSWKWEENYLGGCTKVYLGQLQAVPADKDVTNRLIIRDSTLYGALLFSLDSVGFTKLPSSVPGLWVIAPLEEPENRFGFAINGHFDLDVGRAQLARDYQRNSDEADRIGKDFGEGLVQLFDSCAGNKWPGGKQRLGLAQNLGEYEFWQSLWKIMAEGMAGLLSKDFSSHELRRSILWGENCGMERLVHSREAIPSCLEAGGYRALTKIGSVNYSISGILDQGKNQELLEKITQWKEFKQKVNPGEVVSASRVTGPMEKLLQKKILFEPLYLCTVLEWELANSDDVSPEKAGEIGLAFTSDLFNSLGDEEDQVRKITDKLKFRNEKGEYAIASELVAEGLSPEESRRAGFAPADRLLSSCYTSDAIGFFKECRKEMETSEETLIYWGLTAETEHKRIAFLKYLYYVRTPQQIQKLLAMKTNTWLDQGIDSYLIELEPFEQSIVRTCLRIAVNEPATQIKYQPVDSKKILQCVYSNWKKNRDVYRDKYWKLVYPGNQQPNFMMPDSDKMDDHTQIYHDWLSLFLLGICYTLGRTSYGQNRNFLKLCQDKKWIFNLAGLVKNTITTEDSLDSLDWIDLVDKYIEEQNEDRIPYAWWLSTLMWLYFVAKRLDKYVEVFEAINRDNMDRPSIKNFLSTRTSALFDRGGISAPPLNQTLGIGVFFVVGELYRSGRLYNPNGHEHCYVPTAKVLNLIRELGGPDISIDRDQRWDSSSRIYGFLNEHLDDPTFCSDFDMPLQLMALDPVIKEELKSD